MKNKKLKPTKTFGEHFYLETSSCRPILLSQESMQAASDLAIDKGWDFAKALTSLFNEGKLHYRQEKDCYIDDNAKIWIGSY